MTIPILDKNYQEGQKLAKELVFLREMADGLQNMVIAMLDTYGGTMIISQHSINKAMSGKFTVSVDQEGTFTYVKLEEVVEDAEVPMS